MSDFELALRQGAHKFQIDKTQNSNMKDIYLNHTDQNKHIAQYLKVNIESSSNLLVALANDDSDDCDEFTEHLDYAKVYLILMFQSGNITAWVMDPEPSEIQQNFQRPQDSSSPPHIDFTKSYEQGLDVLRYILKVITGSGDIEMDPKHEKYAVKKERTVSSKRVHFSLQSESPKKQGAPLVPTTVLAARAHSLDQRKPQLQSMRSTVSYRSPDNKAAARKRFLGSSNNKDRGTKSVTSPVKKFQQMMRKLKNPPHSIRV